MPAAEVGVSLELLAHLPVEVITNGWDNLIGRLGRDRAARLPRQAMAAGLIVHEQRWLPILSERLPLPVPLPVRTGRPAPGYPRQRTIEAVLGQDLP
jgi:aminoglycoside phosphotransferase (APT) family kinase protein